MYHSVNSSSKESSPDNSSDAMEFQMKNHDLMMDTSSLSPMDGDQDGEYDINKYLQQNPKLYKSENDFASMSNSKHFRCIDFEKRNLGCPHCTYVTDRKNNLKRHIVTMHQESSKTLDCCGTVFKSKAALREHVSFHHRGGYRCQICGRNFCRKALLRRHLTVHSGQKDYRCRHCAYATSHKSNLERHQKVHAKDGSKHGQLHQDIFEDSIENRKNHIDNVSRNLARWRLATGSLQEAFYGRTCENIEKDENSNFKDQNIQENRILNWMNFNMAFSSLNRHPIGVRRETVISDDSEEIDEEPEKNRADINNGCNAEQCSVQESFASYLKQYLSAESDGHSNGDNADSNDNERTETENEENLPGLVDKHRRHRLSEKPYKCSVCGTTYARQRKFLNHRCGKTTQSGLYFPVTNMIRKGVALAERNARIELTESAKESSKLNAEPRVKSLLPASPVINMSECMDLPSSYTYIL